MSDSARKDFSTKASEALEPESNKSAFQKAKESVTDTADSVSGKAQGEAGEKSYLQQAGDKISSALGK